MTKKLSAKGPKMQLVIPSLPRSGTRGGCLLRGAGQ